MGGKNSLRADEALNLKKRRIKGGEKDQAGGPQKNPTGLKVSVWTQGFGPNIRRASPLMALIFMEGIIVQF